MQPLLGEHDNESPRDRQHRGPLSVYSRTSIWKKDNKNKQLAHLTQRIVEPRQIPVVEPDENPEGPDIEALRSKKVKEFER